MRADGHQRLFGGDDVAGFHDRRWCTELILHVFLFQFCQDDDVVFFIKHFEFYSFLLMYFFTSSLITFKYLVLVMNKLYN